MARYIRYGDEVWSFDDDVTKEEIDAVGNDWMRFGSLAAVRQKRAIEDLVSNPDFLALPRMERSSAFDQFAKSGPGLGEFGPYWSMLKPEERRALRELVVNEAEGANEAESYNYWMAPFSYGGDNVLDKMSVFDEEQQNLLGSAVGTAADMTRRGLSGANDLVASLWAGVTQQLETAVNEPGRLTEPLEKKWAAKYGASGEQMAAWTNPNLLSDEKLGEYTKKLEPEGDSWLERASGDLADDARRVLEDVSIGRSLQHAPTKYGSFEEAREEGGVGGYIRHGLTEAAGQVPQVGTNVALATIPVIGPVLSTEAMMAAETGGALDQMMQDGIEIGLDQERAAVVAGTINGQLERIPIGALFNRIPGFKEPFKKAVLRHTWEVLKQGGLEGVTEFAQNIVTDASIDVASQASGELDKVRWATKEGRAESVGEAWEAAQAGAFTGTIMALFGLGAGQLQRRMEGAPPTGEEMAAAAQPGPEVMAAREIIRGLTGDQGPRVPEMGGMEPTYPDQGPPADAVPGVVAPTGPTPPGQGSLPLSGGPGGAAIPGEATWSELDEQHARFNYRPGWLEGDKALLEAFVRGDIDQETMVNMEALAMSQGVEPMQARADILAARDQAWAFLRGDMVQPEQEPIAVMPGEEPDFVPTQDDAGAQRGFGDGLGVGPAAPGPVPVSPEPVAPTQDRGVETEAMRLGETVVDEGVPPEPITAPPVAPPPVGVEPAVEPEAEPPAEPEDRRERARGREIDDAASVVFRLGREKGMNPELIGTLVDGIVKGDDPETTLRRPIFEGMIDDAMVSAVTDLGEAVFQRYVKSEADRRTEAEIDEMLGIEPEVVPEPEEAELTEEELLELTRGGPKMPPTAPPTGKAMAGAAGALKGQAPDLLTDVIEEGEGAEVIDRPEEFQGDPIPGGIPPRSPEQAIEEGRDAADRFEEMYRGRNPEASDEDVTANTAAFLSQHLWEQTKGDLKVSPERALELVRGKVVPFKKPEAPPKPKPKAKNLPPAIENFRASIKRARGDTGQLEGIVKSVKEWARGRIKSGKAESDVVKQAVAEILAEAETAKTQQPGRGDVPIDEGKKANFDKRVATKGATETVVTPDGSMEEEVQFAVVEAEHLTASHDIDMKETADYPEDLQPRDRARRASEEQVEDIAKNLDPARLAHDRVSSGGAPIVGADGVVESGNARVIALQRVFGRKRGYGESASEYKRYLIDNAEDLGIDKNKLMGMSAPVLVKVRKSAENRIEFAEKSNVPDVAPLAAAETAKSDASKITSEMMSTFVPDESGDVTAASNREFVRLFLSNLSKTERGDMYDAEGELSQDGIRRIENAVLYKAYGEAGGVVESLIESKNNQIKRIGNAMLSAAPRVISVRSAMEQGVNDPALDLVEPFMEAVTTLARLRREGKSVEEHLSQKDLFGADMTTEGKMLLEHLNSKEMRNSAKAMTDFLNRYYNLVSQQTFNEKNPPLMDLGIESATRQELIQMAIDGKGADQGEMFSLGKPDKKQTASVVKTLKEAFPGWAVTKLRDGLWRVTKKGQPVLHVMKRVYEIGSQETIERNAKGHGLTPDEYVAGLRSGEIAVKGSYRFNDITGAHLVSLYAPHADVGTVFHEAFHFAFHNYLTRPQRKLLLKNYGSEEKAADAYRKYVRDLPKKLTTPQKVFEALRNFAKHLLTGVDVTAANKLLSRIATGNIYEQSGRFHVETDPLGSITLKTTANAVLNAEEAAREAEEEIRQNGAPSKWSATMADHVAERAPSYVDRGDHTMFTMGPTPGQVPGEHPAVVLPPMTKTERRREQAKKLIYDKLGPLLRVQEELTGVGELVDSAINAYMKALNFQSRAGGLLDWVNSNLFEPFLDDVAAKGVNLEDFDLFRMAAHALERNLKLRGMHITLPLQVAEKKIESLRKKKITKGAKVRDLKFGNKGVVLAVMPDRGKAQVEFTSPKNPMAKKRVLVDMAQLELESLARERDRVAEIRRMEAAGETPHSGMTDEHARAVLKEMKSLGLVDWTGELSPTTDYTGKMGVLSKKFSTIVRWKENALHRAGLLSKEELGKWRDYKHYAPMRGKDPDIMDIIAGGRRDAISPIEFYGGTIWNRAVHAMARAAGVEETIFKSGAGRGFNPGRRPAAHRALGRRSFPKHSPTVELMTDTMQAAVRAERNRVAKTVWNLVHELKDVTDVKGEKLFEIDTPDSRLQFDEKTGTVRKVVDGLSVTKPNVYSMWIDGKLHYVRAVSPEMAEFISALNNIGDHKDIHPVLKGAAAINRYISKMATSLNPGFVIPNAHRDAITAGIKLAGQEKYKDFGVETMKRAPEAASLLEEYGRRESHGTLDKMAPARRKRVERFKLAGGETAFWMIPDIELQMKRTQKAIRKSKGDQNAVVTGARTIINGLEDVNASVEGMMRFSVFERALELGMTEDQAATLARDITVDFTKQGTAARHLGALWVFANASIQGSVNMAKAVAKNKPVQRIVLGGMVYAFNHAWAMRLFGGDDPEDGIAYWDKIPWYEKSRNLIVMIPNSEGRYVKFPMPWGYNLFTAAATAMSDVVFGPKTAGEATMNVLSTAMSAFNPIGDNDLTTMTGWLQMVTPSPMDPFVDIAINRTFWGGPIKPVESRYKKSEQYGVEAPEYNRYFPSVSKLSQGFTKNLYKYTGIDISPEDVDYGIAAVFGGLGDTVNRFVSMVGKAGMKESVAARDIPIVKSFYGDESKFFAPQMYRENMAEFYLRKETFSDLKKTDLKAATEFYKRHQEILAQEKFVKSYEKRIRELKKMGVKSSDSRMQKEFKQFNRRFNTIEKKAVKRRIIER